MDHSPYQHPAYSTPPPKGITSPSRQTPKRKRSDAAESNEESLGIDTSNNTEHDRRSENLDSPRTKVTEKLKDLNIQQVQPAVLRANERHVPRKRLRRNPGIVDNSSSSGLPIFDSPGNSTYSAQRNENVAIEEVGETPDCRTRTQLSPSDSPGYLHMLDEVHESPTSPKDDHEFAPQLPPSPARMMLLASPLSPSVVIDRSVSPLPLREELSPDQAALTWQDEEITGHEVDPSGEDDGEGINGIGFQPTAAMAYARQQRRKQQVNDWKAREAREARQKRIERRRGATAETSGAEEGIVDAESARMVRFVGVG